MRQRRWIDLFSDYECEIRYHPGKANVVADALSKKERAKPRRVRAMSMKIHSSIKAKILEAQTEASKNTSTPTEMLKGLDKQLERKEDGGLYLAEWIRVPNYGNMRTFIMNEDHATRYSVHPGADKMYYDIRGLLVARNVKGYCHKALGTRLDLSTAYHPKTDGQKTTDKIVQIKERLKVTRDRQKSYADKRQKPLEFSVGDKVLLKVSPRKSVVCFGKRNKLSPRYIRPFEIVERIGPVAYRLRFTQELIGVHDTFHVSNLKKCMADDNLHVPLDEVKVYGKLHFVEEPIRILDRGVKKLKRRWIPIVKSMSAKRTLWNEFSSEMASVVICLSTGRKFNFPKYIFESLVRNVDSSSKFYMYLRFIQLIIQNQLGDLSTHITKYISPALTQKVFANMRRVGKGCSGVETPLFEGMLVAGEPEEQGDAEEQDNVDDAAQVADTTVLGDDVQYQSIPSPTPPPQQPQDLSSTSQEALDACAALTRRVEHLEHDKVAQALEITKLKKRVKKLERANKVKVLKLRILKKVGTSQRIESSADTDIEDASNQGRMIPDLDRDTGVALMDDEGTKNKSEDAQEDEPEVHEVVEVVSTVKLITEVVAAVSESVSAASATIAAVPAATITAAPVKVAAASTRRRKGVAIRDPKELDYFKGMSYDDIRLIFEAKFNLNMEFILKSKEQLEEEENRAIKSVNETPSQKAAKRRKLNDEVEDLKHHLEIVPDENDDVYTEATPLAKKVPVVDYEIVHFNNKPHYKIIRADGTHQLPNGQAQVWKNQRTVHSQAKVKSWKLLESCGVYIITFTTTQLILLFERRYPLSRFTLDQMLNAVRLRVKEQSDMSLELLSAAKQKLMLLDNAAKRRLMMLSQFKTANVKYCC
nr:reverse transcriptase domain-containing protein [Tanacetum cinerariifolium]